MPRYLKVYEGMVEYGQGRGYKETKLALIDSFEELALRHKIGSDVEYYKLKEMVVDEEIIRRIQQKKEVENRVLEEELLKQDIENIKKQLKEIKREEKRDENSNYRR